MYEESRQSGPLSYRISTEQSQRKVHGDYLRNRRINSGDEESIKTAEQIDEKGRYADEKREGTIPKNPEDNHSDASINYGEHVVENNAENAMRLKKEHSDAPKADIAIR
ncbi:hypothetical protein ACOME3_007264 [Neoechinorhynchus agilis]